MQKVHRLGKHKRSLRTVGHRCEQSALRQGRTRRDTISGRLSSIDPVQVRTRGASVVQRGTEGQIKGISKTPRRGDQDVSPLGGLRCSEDELLSGDSPARSPQQGAPDITHGIMSSLARAEGTGMNVGAMRVQGMHTWSARSQGDILAPTRNREERQSTVSCQGMSQDRCSQEMRPHGLIHTHTHSGNTIEDCRHPPQSTQGSRLASWLSRG